MGPAQPHGAIDWSREGLQAVDHSQGAAHPQGAPTVIRTQPQEAVEVIPSKSEKVLQMADEHVQDEAANADYWFAYSMEHHRDALERQKIRNELRLTKGEWFVEYWEPSTHRDRGRYVLQSHTHSSDLVLELNGDFGSKEYQEFVANEIRDLLNAAEYEAARLLANKDAP